MSFTLDKLIRENIANLTPYSSARDDYKGETGIFLDANENPFNSPYNRYPDPHQRTLKQRIAELFSTGAENIFLGNGSDEGIDLLYRAFCEPGVDNVVSIEPSYGMYQVCADIQGVAMRKVQLNTDFSIDLDALLQAVDRNTKLIFLCSPNNPTSNLLDSKAIFNVLKNFDGLVVLDEAYVDFTEEKGLLDNLKDFPNLVILRTFSKAWGLAGIRLGMVFASEQIVSIISRIKYPYNLNRLTMEYAMSALDDEKKKVKWVKEIISERKFLESKIQEFSFVEIVYPSDANFLLVKVKNPKELYKILAANNVIVRDRSGLPLCEGCLRITIGTKEENSILLSQLSKYEKKN